ncbi:hypothetical protein ABZX95_10530 [Streptomyces sp. NPDC004232]|uniref:hypothetical protein n=1 Tax=unclassified Streptomyces TaxID=2593676 RepID=UPI001DD3C6D8|nr:hypothetical protein [Streptomyces sp. tea 10]
MLKLGKAKRAVALGAVTVALAGVATIGLGGTAGAAQTQPRAGTACTSFQVGDKMPYGANGMTAGWISQWYSTCNGYTYGRWDWNTNFMLAHPGRQVVFGVESDSIDGGQPHFGGVLNSTPGNPLFAYWGKPHTDASDNIWRAGAELDNSGCVAWSSAHNYNNGSEVAGPYAGCNDRNWSQIPWTAP